MSQQSTQQQPPNGSRSPDLDSFMNKIRETGAVRPDSGRWAAGVAARTAYKHVRRRRLERRVFRGEHAGNVVALDLSRQIAARRELERVFELLRQLDQDKVFAYLLHDVCGFDLREVAEIVGVSVAAAQSRLVRGRRLVQDALNQGGER